MTRPGEARNWLLAHVSHQGDECLIWPFGRRWNGYGQFGHEGKITFPHRVMCLWAHGNPPDPKCVAAHTCNNGHGGCVNPRHLAWKTPSENLLDRRAAGTLTRKRWNNRGLLTAAEVAQIRALKGVKNQREIAAMFNISYQHVSVVQNNRLRRHRAQ